MATDKNYSRLAQMIAHKDSTEAIIDDILKDGCINYQVPANSIQDSKKKELEGCTALHIVMQNMNIKAAQKLLQNGADFTIQNRIGETILHQTIQPYSELFSLAFPSRLRSRLNSFVNVILDAHVQLNIFKNPSDNYQLSHFHIACIVDHEAAVKYFIKNKVSLNKPVKFDSSYLPGYSPLHLAAKNINFKAFKILLDAGADVKLKNAFGLTPLHLLIQNSKENCTVLMEVSPRLCNRMKEEIRVNQEKIKLILIKYQNKNNDILDDTGLSYLHVLCTLQNTSAIEKYISSNKIDMEHSVKVDSLSWQGYTALHFAAEFSPSIFKVLLKHGSNILAKNANGSTPLDMYLCLSEVEDICSIIESQQRCKDIVLSDGETSLLDLIYAMKSENSLEIFIQKSDVNAYIPMDSPLWPGYSILHLAINLFKVDRFLILDHERISILLNAGANITAKNSSGVTPIHMIFRLRLYDILNSMLLINPLISDSIDEDNVSHLHIACAAGNVNVVRNILQGNVNVNQRSKRLREIDPLMMTDFETFYNFFIAGSTPLHIAVIIRNVEIVDLLINHGADVHIQDDKGLTPIHRLLGLQSEYDHHQVAPMARILFSVDNLRDVVTSFGLNHLHVACWVSDINAIEKLIDQGVDVNLCLSNLSKLLASKDKSDQQLQFLKEYRDYSSLNFALCRKQSNVMILLFKRKKHFAGTPKDVLDAARYTKESASFEGFKKMHESMLGLWELEYGIKPLHVACYQYDLKAVEELLKQGANPNAKVLSTSVYWTGMTPLHFLIDYLSADEKKVKAIAKILIDHGADVTIVDGKGDTVIHQIINIHNFKWKETLLLLLKGQRNFNVNPGIDSQRISHFHASCMMNETSVVEKFLKHNVDVNLLVNPMVTFYGGCTPLQVAVLCNAKETVDLLLKHGADVNARNGVGNTALHCAVIFNKKLGEDLGISELIVMRLIGAGAEVNATNKYGETPLEVLLKTQKSTCPLLKILLKNQCCVNIFNNTNGIGFIATAIKRLTKIQSIFEHPVYQAVISSSKIINKVDKDGRTPIHNIVSIPKIAASVKIYEKAIEGFLNVGINIDHLNKLGQTALHVAVYFKNSKAVAALLSHGANINMLYNGETPFFYHWKNCRNLPNAKLLENERQIVKSFAKQLYKLQLINFNVLETDNQIYAELQAHQWNLDLKVVEQCQVELERMETRKIGRSDIPWWNLMSETGVVAAFPTMRRVERQMICDVFEKPIFHLRREFPEFVGILHMQYRKALDRMILHEPAKAALGSLLNFDVPDLCNCHILRFLGDAELIYLIVAADENPVAHVEKRKKIVKSEAI